MLYEYCEREKVPFNKCGKLIVASAEDELVELDRIYAQSLRNEVENVVRLTAEEALELEPDIHVAAALLSKETGIFDTHSFMKSLETTINRNNGTILYGSALVSIRKEGKIYSLELQDGTEFESEYVINSAGLHAVEVSKMAGMEPAVLYPCKGSYFSYSGRHRCRHLIYPVPHRNLTGLGVHATLDLGGRLRFGPDAEYIDNTSDYAVDPGKKTEFYAAASKILRNVEMDDLVPDMVGIRPKIQGPGDPVKDFYITDEKDSGFANFINLLGMESPGLTGALAIGEHVHRMISLQ